MANINRSRQERRENAENESAENAENAEDVVTAHAVIPHLAENAAEKAAIKELKIAKLKMKLATAKLAVTRANAALEAAKSEKDIAHVKSSFSTRIEKSETKLLKNKVRPPSYWKRLRRREEMREEAEKAKKPTSIDAAKESKMKARIDVSKIRNGVSASKAQLIVTSCNAIETDYNMDNGKDESASEAQLINDVGASKAQPIVELLVDTIGGSLLQLEHSQLKLAQPDVDCTMVEVLKKMKALTDKWKKGATGKGL
jgi:hypothetical protein